MKSMIESKRLLVREAKGGSVSSEVEKVAKDLDDAREMVLNYSKKLPRMAKKWEMSAKDIKELEGHVQAAKDSLGDARSLLDTFNRSMRLLANM